MFKILKIWGLKFWKSYFRLMTWFIYTFYTSANCKWGKPKFEAFLYWAMRVSEMLEGFLTPNVEDDESSQLFFSLLEPIL